MNMKKSLILPVSTIALIVLAAFTLEKSREPKRQYFIVIYTPGSGWNAAKPPGEQLHFKTHSKHLQTLRTQNKITLGARYADKGMIIITGENEGEIRSTIMGDSAVIDKVFTAEIYPYNVFYYGCLEKPK
jgi:hypothetical protein